MNYINCEENPTAIEDSPWIWEKREINSSEDLSEYMDKYNELLVDHTKIGNSRWIINHISEGKWMLFYNESEIDERWSFMKSLFRENRLEGINTMKCSTMFVNYRAMTGSSKVIILYCNVGNEESIKKIGKHIMNISNYNKKMFYKTHEQTAKGTLGTGNSINHLYTVYPEIGEYMLESDDD